MTDPRPLAPDPHPPDELLVAYLTTGLSDDERREIEAHAQRCDRCVENLAVMQRRLSIASEIPTSVPASVQQRARELATSTAVEPSNSPARADLRPPTPVPRPLFLRLRNLLSAVFRLPVLVPIAVAAVVLFVVITQPNWLNPAPQHEMSRSIEQRQVLPVTAPYAIVRAQPDAAARAITTLQRGMRVTVVGEHGDWYQVALSNGSQGWVPRRAFE